MIPVYTWPSEQAKQRIKGTLTAGDERLWNQVHDIVSDIQVRGNLALFEYTQKYDGFTLTPETLFVGQDEMSRAIKAVGEDFLTPLRQSRERILDFHQRQKQQDWFVQDAQGSVVGQLIRPLERVGVYVPGGTASYPSSVLMTCLPALVAGVKEIVMATPAGQDGQIPAATLAAAREAGVTEIVRVGGAQAVAALAYGTQTLRAVDKIVGPGNVYVTLAKKMVFGQVGIDMLAGPSEVLVISDGSVKAAYAAADLLSQVEHDSHARAILVTTDQAWAKETAQYIEQQLAKLPRQSIAALALQNNGAIILVKDLEEAFEVANLVAPEHLELLLADPWPYLVKIKHAGAIFMGPYSPEAVGDYWAGPNHVLPTAGAARFSSPLSVMDFCKRSSLINYSRQGLQQAAAAIVALSEKEGLMAHGESVAIRFREEKA